MQQEEPNEHKCPETKKRHKMNQQAHIEKNRQDTYKIKQIRIETQWKIGNLGQPGKQ